MSRRPAIRKQHRNIACPLMPVGVRCTGVRSCPRDWQRSRIAWRRTLAKDPGPVFSSCDK